MTRYHKHGRRFLALLAGSAVVLAAACGGQGGGQGKEEEKKGDGSRKSGPQSISVAAEQEFVSYNANTASDNALHNSQPLQRVLTGFWFFNEKGEITPNTDFGTFKKTSESPLTVEHEFSPKATWSDGNPIDCDDAVLHWAGQGGKFGFSSASTVGYEDVKVPDCKKGDKKFTHAYNKPFADWNAITPGPTSLLPAHVVWKKAGMTEDAFIDAVQKGDAAKLKAAVKWYNTGWVMSKKKLLPESEIPSAGPYKLGKWDAGQSLTLTTNDKYWGAKPKTPNIVFRWITQEEQAQALQNQEVQLVNPQPNPDLLNQFKGMQNIKLDVSGSYFYEHLDFNFDSSPFKDKRLREAFAKCIPRQLMVDNLIKPIEPKTEVLGARNVLPVEADRYSAVKGDWATKYVEPDIAGAKKLLAAAGKTGMTVKIGYKTPNPRRTQTVALIKSSCDKAGFKVVDQGDAKFFETGGGLSSNTYDVALFGWIGSNLVTGWASQYKTVKGCTPELKESNNGCYGNKKLDPIIDKIARTVDVNEQNRYIKQVEDILWADLATIPLFQNPELTAWNDRLVNIKPNPTSASFGWNIDQWTTK